jgi:hypothetical protein
MIDVWWIIFQNSAQGAPYMGTLPEMYSIMLSIMIVMTQ